MSRSVAATPRRGWHRGASRSAPENLRGALGVVARASFHSETEYTRICLISHEHDATAAANTPNARRITPVRHR